METKTSVCSLCDLTKDHSNIVPESRPLTVGTEAICLGGHLGREFNADLFTSKVTKELHKV